MLNATMPWRLLFLAAASVVVTASLPQPDGGVREPTKCVQLNKSEEIMGIASLNDTLAVASRNRLTLHNIAGQQCRKTDEIALPFPLVIPFIEFKLLNTSSLFFCTAKQCMYCRFGASNFCRELQVLLPTKSDGEIKTAAATQTGDGRKILVKIVFTTQRSYLFAFEEPLLEETNIIALSYSADPSYLHDPKVALGFNEGGYTYFITSSLQPDEPTTAKENREKSDPSYRVKIMRFCDQDLTDQMESRVEISLACPGIDESNNKGVRSATYSATQKKVFVVFVTAETESVVCSYPIDVVNKQVEHTWNLCQNVSAFRSAECKYFQPDEKTPEYCRVFTRMSDHQRTLWCSKYGGDTDGRKYEMCDLMGHSSSAYRYGWLESYVSINGTPVALINHDYPFTRVFLDEWHSSLFLAGDDRMARIPVDYSGSGANDVRIKPSLVKHYSPASRFPLAHVNPSSFLFTELDRVMQHRINCASLYDSCGALASGGFSDHLDCLFCAMPDNESGGFVMDKNERTNCQLPLFKTCPPVITKAYQNAERKEEWIINGDSLQTLNNPIVLVCKQPCIIDVDTAKEKSFTCTLQSSSVLDPTCDVEYQGQLESYKKFVVKPVKSTHDQSTEIDPALIPGYGAASGQSTMSKSWKIVIGVVAVILIVAIIIIIILGARKYLGMRNQKGNGSNGMMFPLENNYQRNATRNTYLSTDPSGMPFATNMSPAHAPAYERLFREIDSRLKIPSDHLILEKQIGKGHFGVVIKGTYNPPDGQPRSVACKTLTGHVAGGISEFVNEGLMMDRFDHPRVMTLVGISFNEDRMPIIVTDYMENGDLAKYLRDVKNKPTLRDLLNFTHEIAQGMQYLHDNKFIHRDLAARNCMLDRNIHVKIADFGLCREATSQDEYLPIHSGREMPLRWMAPEALEREQFTMAGDVWAFGVVIWEVMTRGMNPYPNLQAYVLFEFLKAGKRMGKPDFCPDILFRVMLDCWHGEPTLRPTFKELPDQIEEIIDVLSSNSRVQMNAEYEQCNSVRNSRAASSSVTTPITHHAISHVHSLPMDQSPDPTPV